MKFTSIAGSELATADPLSWRELQRSNPELQSPYFSPEFTLAVAAVRNDVRVTVMEEGPRLVGYFPFERGPFGNGRPVGGILSDYHGVVCEPGATFDVPALLRGSRLAFWEFDHLPAGQTPFSSYVRRRAGSPALDLSQGFDAYREGRRNVGSNRVSQLERKARKLARDVGPLRFEAHVEDRKVLERVFTWKGEQCRSSGGRDFFALGWPRALVERILATQTPHFAGMLSALYAGDHLVAAHMGMRSERVWHWWFPVYDHAFGKYSPGAILLMNVAEAAAKSGLSTLDLGKGEDAYKASFANTEFSLLEGCAERPSLAASVRRVRHEAERVLRASPLAEPVKPFVRRARKWVLARTSV